MNKRNLNLFSKLYKDPMTRADSLVMAQEWILSTKVCRHAVPARGFLRSAREVQE